MERNYFISLSTTVGFKGEITKYLRRFPPGTITETFVRGIPVDICNKINPQALDPHICLFQDNRGKFSSLEGLMDQMYKLAGRITQGTRLCTSSRITPNGQVIFAPSEESKLEITRLKSELISRLHLKPSRNEVYSHVPIAHVESNSFQGIVDEFSGYPFYFEITQLFLRLKDGNNIVGKFTFPPSGN